MTALVKKMLGMKEALKEKLLQVEGEEVPATFEAPDNSEQG